MEIRGNKPAEGSEGRRFSAAQAAPKPGAKSFGAALKQAVAGPGSPPGAPSAPLESASRAPGPAEKAPDREAATAGAPGSPAPEARASVAGPAGPAGKAEAGSPPAAEPETSFADHMEMVRFRLKTGYYASKAIDDALTDKLSGYFDDLADPGSA